MTFKTETKSDAIPDEGVTWWYGQEIASQYLWSLQTDTIYLMCLICTKVKV